MAQSSNTLHENVDDLRAATVDRHRAIVSLQEELEAIDWYDQRIDATSDAELREVLRHNRDEEKEHAAMTLEWLRRNDPVMDSMLRQYLFTDGPITDEGHEAGGTTPAGGAATAVGAARGPADNSLGIGRLRREEL